MTPVPPLLDPDRVLCLKDRIDQPAARPRVTLALAAAGRSDAAAIGSIEPALASQLASAGLPLRDLGYAWHVELSSDAEVDPALSAIAQWLFANGFATAWRDELLPVIDVSGQRVGAIERAAVRPLGIATHAVHMVASDAHGRVWVQQRAFDKATDPGLWDTTMGGLAAAGESVAQTLERETWEEAGLRVGDLHGLAHFGRITVRRPLAKGYMVEHIEMFEATLPDGRVPVNQDGEVERFDCIDLAALVERLHADVFTVEAAVILAAWLELQSRRSTSPKTV